MSLPHPPHQPLKVSDYEISEEHLENVAREFYGTVLYPAGNHDMAHLSFEDHSKNKINPGPTAYDYRQAFLTAMRSYKKPTPSP